MQRNIYENFVKPTSPTEKRLNPLATTLSGEDAKRLYLEEIRDATVPISNLNKIQERIIDHRDEIHISDKQIFIAAQNNDVDTLKKVFHKSPDKINILDDYGWSLLMIACQANSVDTVQELLKMKINTSVRDKAGNSAHNLVIKNKNFVLADLLLSHKSMDNKARKAERTANIKVKLKEEFFCESCNKKYSDKTEHLSSTIHNINASKGRKIPINYVIPQSNKGYQLMLRVGWDKESGLGPDGTGTKYPIKTVQKQDRMGLGHNKRKAEEKFKEDRAIKVTKKTMAREHHRSRKLEINFRREFY